ncbi:MAG: serine hydrolase [Clostridiales bacterium]|nr:serine hydrolase [Candidatus Coliplasma equi]
MLYLSDKVNADAVAEVIKECEEQGIHFRCVQVLRGGEPQLKMAFEPYDIDAPMHLYSLSKSFTSVAFGICCDEGLITPESHLSEIFPDKMPENPSEEIKKMRFCDLLSMRSGHGVCALAKMRWSEDAIKAFFEQPIPNEPGTKFIYSTGATCVCAAAVEKVTGRKLVDFLDEKLFSILECEKPVWLECRDGQTLGGTGLMISSETLTKFGLMLRNGGVYNGKRIVSEKYLRDATSVHADNSCNGTPDWVAGYGWQFWINDREGFRGDGAFGQLCVILPSTDTVVTVMGEVGNMQNEMTMVYKLVDTMFDGKGDEKALGELIKNLYSLKKSGDGFNKDVAFDVAENVCEIKNFRFYGEKLLHVVLETGYGRREFVCGNGEYILNHFQGKCLSPTISQLDPALYTVERVNVFAGYEKLGENRYLITLRHYDTPHVQRWEVDLDAGVVDIKVFVGDMIVKHFEKI